MNNCVSLQPETYNVCENALIQNLDCVQILFEVFVYVLDTHFLIQTVEIQRGEGKEFLICLIPINPTQSKEKIHDSKL